MLQFARWLLLIDLSIIVMTGGVSLVGETSGTAFGVRVAIAIALFARAAYHQKRRIYAFIVVLLLLYPLLHYRGYRLRGDGLWYYSFTHSVAFDLDIDLGNQYARLGIENNRGSQPVRETARPRFTYPVGAPLAWVPIVWVGHIAAFVSNLYGVEARYDGFSDPYFHTLALGNLLIGWLGLLVLDRFLRRWFDDDVAFLATLGIGLATFLGFYLTYHAIYTHALTFLLIGLYLTRWVQKPKSVSDFVWIGLLLGAAACVRWQNGVFGLLLAPELVRLARALDVRRIAGFGAAMLAGLLPQLVSWKILFDRLYIGVPLGEGYMRWSDPFVTETLFSSRHGLLSWSPILIAAFIGLVGFVWRHPRIGLPLTGMLVLLTYVNSSVADWWAGGAFGSRRFDSVLPILALGLATSIAYVMAKIRRHPATAVGALLAVFVGLNVLLMEQLRKGRIPVDSTMSWQAAWEGMLEDVFDGVGYPFSFPMNWLFAERYDRPKTQYDILVGQYLFHRMGSLNGVIDIGLTDPAFLGNGWSGLKDWNGRPREVRWAEAPGAGVFVPTDRAETLRVYVSAAAPPSGVRRPVEVLLNGRGLGSFYPDDALFEHAFTADARFWKRINLLEFRPADAPALGEGEPFLALDRLRFERLTP